METIKIGILVSSDRASQGVYEDISGKAIREILVILLQILATFTISLPKIINAL